MRFLEGTFQIFIKYGPPNPLLLITKILWKYKTIPILFDYTMVHTSAFENTNLKLVQSVRHHSLFPKCHVSCGPRTIGVSKRFKSKRKM